MKFTHVFLHCFFCVSDLVIFGVGYHHAGLDHQDRKSIENMFLSGDLPVLSKSFLRDALTQCRTSFHL